VGDTYYYRKVELKGGVERSFCKNGEHDVPRDRDEVERINLADSDHRVEVKVTV
jgi:hypothetical protein